MGPFAGKPLRAVTLTDVKRLVDGGVTESKYLDYKRELNLSNRDEYKEFARDVTAFANADGGTIIYGVEEDRSTGLPKAVTGFGVTNCDALRLKIEEILKDAVDERLPAFELEALPLDASTAVLLLRVPPSIRAPHIVIASGDRRFLIRTNSGKQEMSTAQIRDAVLRSDSVTERVQSFVQGRVAKWSKQFRSGPFWMLHVIPLFPTDPLDLSDDQMIRRLSLMKWPTASDHLCHCLDGYKVLFQWKNSEKNVTQRVTFRDGTVELLDQYAFMIDGNLLSGVQFQRILRETLESVFELYHDGTLHPPLAICLSLHRVQGFTIPDDNRSSQTPRPIDEDNVTIDPIVLTEIPKDVLTAVRPALDVIWNAFGYSTSQSTDGRTG